MILVTGASGKTGLAVIRRLALDGARVRAWAHHSDQASSLLQAGAVDVVSGDLMQTVTFAPAFRDVEAVYHICSNMNPFEVEIGENLLREASKHHVRLFGYHSVFHPHIQQMPHHWKKLQVEQAIFRSGLDFVILQPTAYMQNILAYWKQITTEGKFTLPYSPQTRLSLVDLEDVAQAASKIMLNPGYAGGIYELVGTPALSQLEVSEVISKKLGKPVQAETVSRFDWEENARKNGIDDYAVATLIEMFMYYETYGMGGSQKGLEFILNRPATHLDQFLDRILAGTSH